MPDYQSIDEERLAAAVAKDSFTGVVTIDVGDDRVFERAYGFAHRAHRVPVSVDTRFGIASGSKAHTALAVMRLVEDGLLNLGDQVRSVLGADLPLIDDEVTVEHLLTHTSGIGDYLDEEADWDADDYVLPVPVHLLDQIEAFVPVLDGYPQSFSPGERFAYCNGGYVVLALSPNALPVAHTTSWSRRRCVRGPGWWAPSSSAQMLCLAMPPWDTCTPRATGRTCSTFRSGAPVTAASIRPLQTCIASGAPSSQAASCPPIVLRR